MPRPPTFTIPALPLSSRLVRLASRVALLPLAAGAGAALATRRNAQFAKACFALDLERTAHRIRTVDLLAQAAIHVELEGVAAECEQQISEYLFVAAELSQRYPGLLALDPQSAALLKEHEAPSPAPPSQATAGKSA